MQNRALVPAIHDLAFLFAAPVAGHVQGCGEDRSSGYKRNDYLADLLGTLSWGRSDGCMGWI